MDANTYIQAKNFHYNMSFCPAYWDWLDKQFANGEIVSIQIVYDELTDGSDELAEWVKNRKGQFIGVSDDRTQEIYIEIVNYVMDMEGKKQQHKDTFLEKADPWLIAKALATGATIVTHEVLDPPNSTKVKIPNICKKFGVGYMSTYELLEALEAKFVLGI
jgi:hypothetical protein